MPLYGPKANGPVYREIAYRINQGVKPYAGRLLHPEYEEQDRVGGRIKGVTAIRWYNRSELTPL